MAVRLGLKPWESERLTPREIRELYDGMMWRHSRQIEIAATHALLVRAMLVEKDDRDDLLSMFPYYRKDSDGQ